MSARGRGRGKGPPISKNGEEATHPVMPWAAVTAGNQSSYIGTSRQGMKQNKELNSGERKFSAACKEIQESVERYIASHQMEDADEDLQEDGGQLLEVDILERVLGNYNGTEEMDRTNQCLQDAFKQGALVCLICIENIKRVDAIWNCMKCHNSFHIVCVQKWAKESIYYQIGVEEGTSIGTLPWCCPKCRSEYHQSQIPTKYFCFCGKQMDPKFDPWLIPHSCGEVCGKKLLPHCGHTCLLLCHPGPCPPCPKMVSADCHCNGGSKQIRRCCSKAWSCGNACGRLLDCGQHPCGQICHASKCPPCPQRSRQACFCGSSIILRECASPNWHCDKVCNKLYDCGFHVCDNICHKGDCGSCPKSGSRFCPCGKVGHSLPCNQDIPTCGDTCGKLLSCGVHYCAERCHRGICPSCVQVRVKRCRCGAREKELVCGKDFLCEIKCKKLKDCGRHPCNRKCCTGECQACEQMCGRPLACGNHKCESRCHPGPCYPCVLKSTLTCACHETSTSVACGREKSTKPPRCLKICLRASNCHHPQREEHRCHQGDCPPCRIVCHRSLPCGHFCPAPCHDQVAVKVIDTKKRSGPWEKIVSPHIQLMQMQCPPCVVPVATTCIGLHERPDWPCSDIRAYSCGRPCGRTLACTNHTCTLMCHEVCGALNETKAGSNCNKCESQCTKPRRCIHPCRRECHAGDCDVCQQLVKIKCHCGLNQPYVKCHLLQDGILEDNLLSCHAQCPQMMSCGHTCNKECHSGACSESQHCKKRVTIRCVCKRQKKDVLCNARFTIECDDVCQLKKEETRKIQEEEGKKKLEEEALRQQNELIEFQRKMEGRRNKKRNRKNTDNDDGEKTLIQKYKWILICTSIVALVAIVYIAFQ